MKGHTTLGATLFTPEDNDLAELAYEISLHHHQKWNGQGYPTSGRRSDPCGCGYPALRPDNGHCRRF
jgi:Response regulator containing a CheY-like receiver domain and an HD-GYP domain